MVDLGVGHPVVCTQGGALKLGNKVLRACQTGLEGQRVVVGRGVIQV